MYAPSPPIDPSLQHTPPPLARQSPNQQHYYPSLPQNYAGGRGPSGMPGNLEGFEFLQDFSFPSEDPSGMHNQAGQGAPGNYGGFDMGFGAGGLAFDGGEGPPWDENGGFDLFDGFFFGGTGGGGGGPR